MSKKETIKRYCLAVVSLFVLAIGVALTKMSNLGVAPISSMANVMSIIAPVLSIGNWLIVSNLIMILIQFILLRRDFKLIQLLQIPVSFLFGYFTDFWVWVISFAPPEGYFVQLIYALVGICILALGITMCVTANVIMNPPEAAVLVISQKLKKEYGTVKIFFDCSCITVAIVLGLVFFGKIVGIREGTLISACCVGLMVKFWSRLLKEKVNSILRK